MGTLEQPAVGHIGTDLPVGPGLVLGILVLAGQRYVHVTLSLPAARAPANSIPIAITFSASGSLLEGR
jgi:hypothetical protein